MNKNDSTHTAWYDLDNAAKIFPAISDDRNTNVFRLFCELQENIDKVLLQKALDISIKSFSYFRVAMRRGLFWYYLESTNLMPQVKFEDTRPCSRLFYMNVKELMFEVSYYRRRINLEVFHCVADGSGAFELLRTVVYNYLVLAHGASLPAPLPPLDSEGSPTQKAIDSFAHHYNPNDKQSPRRVRAYTIGGTLLPKNSINIVQGELSTKAMLTLAKSHSTTITAYLCALLICSIYSELMPKNARNKNIGVTLPVDLRGHFSSQSSRNFFVVVDIIYNFGGEAVQFDKVLQSVSQQMAEKITSTNLARRMNYTMSMQKNVIARFIPLFLKNYVLKLAYHRGETSTTCALSNLGRITMPECFSKYIASFSVLLNPTPIHRLKLTVSSYNESFILAFTSCTAETSAQKYFFRHLSDNAVDVCITSNGVNNNEVL